MNKGQRDRIKHPVPTFSPCPPFAPLPLPRLPYASGIDRSGPSSRSADLPTLLGTSIRTACGVLLAPAPSLRTWPEAVAVRSARGLGEAAEAIASTTSAPTRSSSPAKVSIRPTRPS